MLIVGRDNKPAVVAGEEPGEEDVRRVAAGDPREPELGDEPVLERPPEALDPALRLGAAGENAV